MYNFKIMKNGWREFTLNSLPVNYVFYKYDVVSFMRRIKFCPSEVSESHRANRGPWFQRSC